MDHYYALILAGGGGTRLWPMSRKDTPKQLLPLISDQSMFHTSVTRLAPLFSPEQIFVVTGRSYVEALRAEVPEIPAENFILEPYGRDNAAATGLALATIQHRDSQAVVAILTADHHIGQVERFRAVLQAAHAIALDHYIVTLGISPTFPATGFGYIEQGPKIGSAEQFVYHRANRFTEKPDVVRATQFVASGRFSWNSGMFIWQVSQAMREFERQQPVMFGLLQRLQATIGTSDYATCLAEIWEEMPRKSIDFAIMEGAERMAVIPVDIGWSDVGTWASLYEILPQDKFGNCAQGSARDQRVILDTRNTLVVSDRLTVTIGVENLVVVETGDALLICHKDRTQDIKQVVDYLRETGNASYL